MALSLVNAGSNNFGGTGVEVALASDQNGGVYMGYLDASGLAGADAGKLRLYSKVNQGGALRLHKESASAFGPAAADPAIQEIGPVISTEQCDFRFYGTAGATVAAMPWRFEMVGRVSALYQGTQVATINTEHVLATLAFGGIFLLLVDVGNLAGGDTLQLRLYTRSGAGGGGGSKVVKFQSLSGAQTLMVAELGPIAAQDYCQATLKQTAGTGRSYDWKLVRIG